MCGQSCCSLHGITEDTETPFKEDDTPAATVKPTQATSQRSEEGIISSHNLPEFNPDEINFISPPRPPQLNLCPATFSAIQLKDGGREEERGD